MSFVFLEGSKFKYLIRVRPSDSYRIEKIFKAMRDRPEVQSHLVGHQSVGIIKQVDISPGQWTVLLGNKQKRLMN